MKKLVFTITILVILLYLYTTKNISTSTDTPVSASTLLENSPVEAFPFSNKNFSTEKIKKLTISNEQCKQRSLDFGRQVDNINHILVQALEHELRSGKSERELLAYSGQYEVFYVGFDDLLRQAITNIEKEKYNFTSSVEILNEWKGLSVLKNFSAITTPVIVQALTAFDSSFTNTKIGLGLDSDVNKSDILALLDNDGNFNTYLESPLGIGGSPVLSPSILFLLTAEHLTLEEFKQAISQKDFNVNDMAIAVKNDLPIEYLEALIKQTRSIEDMPTFELSKYESYNNLADVASSMHNVKLLKLLEQYGVHPTNELGIITGLDIAILNLPRKKEFYLNSEDLPEKYIDTINYLMSKGYRAHGSRYELNNETAIFFAAPNRRNLQTINVLEPNLKSALHQIDLIDGSYGIEQAKTDNQLISRAIETMELRKQALSDKSKSCESIKKELLAEEGFLDQSETNALIEKISQEGSDFAEKLHEIDPALVNLWRSWSSNRDINAEKNSKFINLLRTRKYQDAFEYSASTALTEFETDTLLYFLVRDLKNLAPIWNARVTATPPSNLIAFKYIPFATWQSLDQEGFDFSIKDKFGNDLFPPAALNSPQTIEFLLSKNLKPAMGSLGVDVLDLLLENTYETGKLNENVRHIITEVEKIEPSHLARIARIKKYFPEEYEKLIKINNKFLLNNEVEINRFRSKVL